MRHTREEMNQFLIEPFNNKGKFFSITYMRREFMF